MRVTSGRNLTDVDILSGGPLASQYGTRSANSSRALRRQRFRLSRRESARAAEPSVETILQIAGELYRELLAESVPDGKPTTIFSPTYPTRKSE